MLLTTPPNEPHAMGLLMVEAVLSLEGAQCISLGTQMPLPDIAQIVSGDVNDVHPRLLAPVYRHALFRRSRRSRRTWNTKPGL